jgi:hypothetical protein
MSSVVIDIAAQFTGKPAFKKADTAVDKLNKSTQNLGRTLTRTFGTAAVLAFGRASVKAFTEDDKAATSLGQTLKNLNLAYGSNIGTVNGFISRLEQQTGVLDDELRPAMDRLLRATGSVTESQQLLGLALDIAAGTGKTVTQVSQSLQKAYLGQTQALGRLGVGLTKVELASGSFEEIQQKLTTLFAGQASAAAETYAGQLDKLTIAANNAKETIGKGLVEAIIAATGGSTVSAIGNIQKLATGIGDTVKNVGLLIGKLGDLKPVLIAVGLVAAAAFLPLTTAIAGAIFLLGDLNKRLDEQSFRKGVIPKGMGNISMTVSGQVDNTVLKTQTKVTKLTKEQAAAQAKILKDKKLAAAIDKANLLLGKGENIFDMEKIQNAAALKNQQELLSKAENGTQLLQIANDTARLNVKRSISELEDAIASKDEAAIIAATKKLDKDIKVLDALTGQNTQMAAIESILKGLVPKELIDQNNLNLALAKIKSMLEDLKNFKWPTAPSMPNYPPPSATNPFVQTPNGISPTTPAASIAEINKANEDLGGVISVIGENGKEFIKLIDGLAPVFQTIEDSGAFNALVNSFASGNIGSFGAGSAKGSEGSIFNSGAVGSRDRDIVINVTTGIGDPNAIAETIDQYLQDAIDRGTLRVR